MNFDNNYCLDNIKKNFDSLIDIDSPFIENLESNRYLNDKRLQDIDKNFIEGEYNNLIKYNNVEEKHSSIIINNEVEKENKDVTFKDFDICCNLVDSNLSHDISIDCYKMELNNKGKISNNNFLHDSLQEDASNSKSDEIDLNNTVSTCVDFDFKEEEDEKNNCFNFNIENDDLSSLNVEDLIEILCNNQFENTRFYNFDNNNNSDITDSKYSLNDYNSIKNLYFGNNIIDNKCNNNTINYRKRKKYLLNIDEFNTNFTSKNTICLGFNNKSFSYNFLENTCNTKELWNNIFKLKKQYFINSDLSKECFIYNYFDNNNSFQYKNIIDYSILLIESAYFKLVNTFSENYCIKDNNLLYKNISYNYFNNNMFKDIEDLLDTMKYNKFYITSKEIIYYSQLIDKVNIKDRVLINDENYIKSNIINLNKNNLTNKTNQLIFIIEKIDKKYYKDSNFRKRIKSYFNKHIIVLLNCLLIIITNNSNKIKRFPNILNNDPHKKNNINFFKNKLIENIFNINNKKYFYCSKYPNDNNNNNYKYSILKFIQDIYEQSFSNYNNNTIFLEKILIFEVLKSILNMPYSTIFKEFFDSIYYINREKNVCSKTGIILSVERIFDEYSRNLNNYFTDYNK